MQELNQRLNRINQLKEKLDAMLLMNKDMQFNPNFVYFTDNPEIAGFLFYDFDNASIFTNARDYPMAKRSWIRNVEISKKGTLEKLIKGKKIGVDFSTLYADTYELLKKSKAKLVNISGDLEHARTQKTPYEVSCIKQACNITGKVFAKVRDQWHGLSEIEFKGLIEYEMHRFGVEPSFPSIVATGKNIAVPHHKPTTEKIKLPLLVDFGVRYKNYVSDVTRTEGSKWGVLIEKILNNLYPNVKPGMKAKALDLFVRKALGSNEKHFITSLGHGIGIAVHERPWISRRSDDALKAGMIFTIEPGVYVPNGIRIENDFLLKEDGLECLTEF